MNNDIDYSSKKIVDLRVNEAEFVNLGYSGEVDAVKAHYTSPVPTTTLSKVETTFLTLINDPDARKVVGPHLISEYERRLYYKCLSNDPPELLYRSDLETNSFPIPSPGTPFSEIPSKFIKGIFDRELTEVWESSVAPQTLALLKRLGIKYSSLEMVRFTIVEGGKRRRGPVVLWICVRPSTINAETARDATHAVLNILAEASMPDVVVEWREGAVVHF